ncbi:hypothetical protein QQZ08_004607 [Neonectria magnoliae]|uniref:Uncharacterized protein n=1 Tax=Neonectria magnoliae TaxID=2732573 RepID=A0ABR1I7M7_9HYPO
MNQATVRGMKDFLARHDAAQSPKETKLRQFVSLAPPSQHAWVDDRLSPPIIIAHPRSTSEPRSMGSPHRAELTARNLAKLNQDIESQKAGKETNKPKRHTKSETKSEIKQEPSVHGSSVGFITWDERQEGNKHGVKRFSMRDHQRAWRDRQAAMTPEEREAETRAIWPELLTVDKKGISPEEAMEWVMELVGSI